MIAGFDKENLCIFFTFYNLDSNENNKKQTESHATISSNNNNSIYKLSSLLINRK